MYTFKLQPVLDHRQHIEDNLKKELAQCKQQVIAAKRHVADLNRKEMNTAAALKMEQEKGLASDQVVAYHRYLRRLADQIGHQRKRVGQLAQQEAAKHDELIEAVKKRQVLEKLKEQGVDRYNQAMLKKEMKFIDEIAVNRFVRKTMNGHGESE